MCTREETVEAEGGVFSFKSQMTQSSSSWFFTHLQDKQILKRCIDREKKILFFYSLSLFLLSLSCSHMWNDSMKSSESFDVGFSKNFGNKRAQKNEEGNKMWTSLVFYSMTLSNYTLTHMCVCFVCVLWRTPHFFSIFSVSLMHQVCRTYIPCLLFARLSVVCVRLCVGLCGVHCFFWVVKFSSTFLRTI